MRKYLAVAAALACLLIATGAAAHVSTDTSNLDNLANAITSSSNQTNINRIKAYAQAQAAATQSQENAIQEAYAHIDALEARIAALEGGTPPPPPPPTGDTQAPSVPGSLRVTSTSQTAISVAWDAATDNVGVTNYKIYRGSTLLGQGPGSSGGFENAWSDSSLTCGTSYTYSVEAQDDAGNTSPKATVTSATSACDTPPPPPPPTGGTTMTAAQFEAACNVAGAVIDSVTVNASGSVTCNAANVTVKNSKLSGIILDIDPSANGFLLSNTDISNGGFNVWGADNVIIEDGAFDGAGRVTSNQTWDTPAGNAPTNLTIRRNSFSNYRGADCSVHGEALFLGGLSSGLVENNTFSQNGCTSHIFFSWWGNTGDTSAYPRNWCVRGNTFGPRFAETFFDVNFREEIPSNANIKINQPGALTTNPEFNATC